MGTKGTYCSNCFAIDPHIQFLKSQLNSVVGGQIGEDRFLDTESHWQGPEGEEETFFEKVCKHRHGLSQYSDQTVNKGIHSTHNGCI